MHINILFDGNIHLSFYFYLADTNNNTNIYSQIQFSPQQLSFATGEGVFELLKFGNKKA